MSQRKTSGQRHGAVGVRCLEDGGSVRVCAEANMPGNYHTLCGVSLDDDQFEAAPIPESKRIDCNDCKAVWLAARAFKADDFTRD